MNNLIRIYPGAETNEILAAQTELPLAFRIHNNGSPNTRTVKSDFILRTGSHHGFPLNALFAYRLFQDLSNAGNTIERITELRESNLNLFSQNPSNIAAIISCMPHDCDPARIIKLAFPDCDGAKATKSDFHFFLKNNEGLCNTEPSDSVKLIAEIYTLLQRCNRIQPTSKFEAKLDSIVAKTRR